MKGSGMPIYPRLKNRNMEPPGGWIYRDLDTGMWTASKKNIDDLIAQCIAHRRANDLPIPSDFAQKIETSLAFSVSPELAIDLPDDRKIGPRAITLYHVNKATNAYLLGWRLKAGMAKVDGDEALGRAETCASCKFNNRTLCLTCNGSDQWIGAWTGRRSKFDPVLGVCEQDGIILYATLHSKHPPHPLNGVFPAFCWKAKMAASALETAAAQ
jgi:hypothetical protein